MIPHTSILFVVLTLVYQMTCAQISLKEIGELPEPVSNNAVVEGYVNGSPYLFSFGGIDSSKSAKGIHLKCTRYNLLTGVSESIPNLPDSLGKVACAASRIGDTIFISGGYHVFSDGSEKTSNRLHRYLISQNQFISDGANIPTPTDDHVQVVWKNKLIYLITGWNDIGNIPNVQVYDPSTNQWFEGTSVPNNNAYKSFGASGIIIGDTILYFGGASSSGGFKIQSWLRKGVINPSDPTQISWSFSSPDPSIVRYRSAALVSNNIGYWVGGSETTYNYNGIAYNGSGGVDPTKHIVSWKGQWQKDSFNGLPMDLRGYGKLSNSRFYIIGGMLSNQVVSNKVFELRIQPEASMVQNIRASTVDLYPNPATTTITIRSENPIEKVRVINHLGQTVTGFDFAENTLSIHQLKPGIYRVVILFENGLQLTSTFTKHTE